MPTTADVNLAAMTVEAKRTLLGSLLLDLTATTAEPLEVVADGREFCVYRVPENAKLRAERYLASLTPADIAELHRRATTPSEWLTEEELLISLREESETLSRLQ